jgi:hypothetical protein
LQVIWIVQTDNPRDIAWLNNVLLPSEPDFYTSKTVEGTEWLHCYPTSSQRHEAAAFVHTMYTAILEVDLDVANCTGSCK